MAIQSSESSSPSMHASNGSQPRSRTWRFAGWTGLGLGLLILAVFSDVRVVRPLVQLGVPILLIAAFVHWRVQRVRRRSDGEWSEAYWLRVAKGMWRPQGSAFYSLVAALTFLYLQAGLLADRGREVWDTWRGAPYGDRSALIDFLSEQLWSGAIDLLVAVSVESILNAVWAGLWPMLWIRRFDLVAALGAVVVAYATYRLARRYFPGFDAVMRQVDAPPEANRASEELQVEPEEAPRSTQ